MNKFNFKNLTPFKWFVLENFPFIEADFDALTEWQLFCKIGKEINKIINSTNTLGTQVESLTDYVTNYFDNLDVQEEINNKLNEMVESGELQEIISEYINLKSILVYKTVNDMKNATNLVNGSIVKTLGFYELNDSGSAYYKIRNITNTDVVNEKNIIALSDNNLIAEFILTENYINPVQLGAKFDDITDDSESWQLAINYAITNRIKIIGLKKNSKILNSLIIPVELNIENMWLSGYDNGNYIQNYMLLFNTENGTEWLHPYNEGTFSTIENIRLENKGNNNLNGILIGGNITITNLNSVKLNITAKQMDYYLDVIIFKNVSIYNKIGNNYAIDLSLLGDANYIDTIHIHNTSENAENNLLSVGAGKNPFIIKNVINGKILFKGGIVSLNGYHGEYNSQITCQNCIAELENISIYAQDTNSPININNSKVSIKNLDVLYSYNENHTTDIDIKIENECIINIENCYKNIRDYADRNKSRKTQIKTSKEIDTQPFISTNGTISNRDEYNNTFAKSYDLRDSNLYYLNNVGDSLEREAKWRIPSGTYYYCAHMLVDKVRMVGRGNNHSANKSLTENSTAISFNIPRLTPIRIYRGLANNVYDKYIDLVNYDTTIFDNGEICGGYKWKDRTSGNVDTYLTATNIKWNGKNVIVYADRIPTVGTWKKGDIIINNNPTSGSPKGWICTNAGTPGEWISLGNL